MLCAIALNPAATALQVLLKNRALAKVIAIKEQY